MTINSNNSNYEAPKLGLNVLRHAFPIGGAAGLAIFATALFVEPLSAGALAAGGLTFIASVLAFGEGYLEGLKAGVSKFRPWKGAKGG